MNTDDPGLKARECDTLGGVSDPSQNKGLNNPALKGWVSSVMKPSHFFLLFLMGFSPLWGKIDSITIEWNPGFCNRECALLLTEQFKKKPEITKINVNSSDGKATLEWDENKPFSYYPIKYSMQRVGVGVKTIHIKVEGKVEQKGDQIYLISSGDNTEFLLIPPLEVNPTNLAQYRDPRVYGAPAEFSKGLLDLGDKDLVIVGALRNPSRPPPPELIVETYEVKKETEQNPKPTEKEQNPKPTRFTPPPSHQTEIPQLPKSKGVKGDYIKGTYIKGKYV